MEPCGPALSGWFLLAEGSPVSVSSTSLASNLLTVPRTLNLGLQLGPHSRTLNPDASWAHLPGRPRTPQTQHVPTKAPSCHQQLLLPPPDLRGCAQPFTLKTLVSPWTPSLPWSSPPVSPWCWCPHEVLHDSGGSSLHSLCHSSGPPLPRASGWCRCVSLIVILPVSPFCSRAFCGCQPLGFR